MRRIAAALVLGFCIAGAAFAQNVPVDGRFVATWEPSSSEAFRHYPESALSREIPGAVELCCTPRADRTIDCQVAFEWPTGFGFGDAALRISESSRMTPESYAAFEADPDAWMQMPIRFQIQSMRPEYAQALERISTETQRLCHGWSAPVS